MGYDLGVDLGTTYTAAATFRDGRAEIATLGTRALEIPSVAFLPERGRLLVGEPAERRGLLHPGRVAREFKRRIGDPTPILLGGTPFSAHALTAHLLRTAVQVVVEREGGPPDHTVVTCPANWSAYKRDLLEQAVVQADIGEATLRTEPEAAAVHYASTTQVSADEVIGVYDLGGGTFDATILRRHPSGFELLGEPRGLEQLGGVSFDAAVLAHVVRQREEELARLDPNDPATVRALARLRRECVEAKEALSSDTEVSIPVELPGVRTEVRLTRAELEAMIRPALLDTIETMRRALESVQLEPDDLAAVVLVGGSSRIPLVSEVVATELGRPVAVDIHPKHAVAMGGARLAAGAGAVVDAPDAEPELEDTADELPAPEVPPVAGPPAPPPRKPATPRPAGRVRIAVGVLAAAAVVAGITRMVAGGDGSPGTDATGSAASTQPERLPPCPAAEPLAAGSGGELVDTAVFSGAPAGSSIDPAADVTPASLQVVDALYDGLTEIDSRDPANPRIVPQVAESYDAEDGGARWTFRIRDGLRFSDGEPVLPSSFVRGWERASDPALGGSDAFLFALVAGGQERLEGGADHLAGLSADDDALTLEVRLARPYADFDALVGHQPFMPMPAAVDDLADPAAWEDGLMVGNGPFMLAAPRTADEVVLVPNPEWNGTCYAADLGLVEQPGIERLTLRSSADPTAAYDAFTAGEAQTALAPAGQLREAAEQHPNTLDGPLLTTSVLQVNWEDPVVGGADNRLLRQAISLALDRTRLAEVRYEGTAEAASGITTPAMPGFVAGLCAACTHDPDGARAALAAWQSAGNELTEPLRVQSTSPAGSQAIVDDLAAVGIPAVAEQPGDDYIGALAAGACQLCVVNGFASYLSSDSLLAEFFHSRAIGRANYGRFSNEEFDRLADEATATLDPDRRADLYQQAERLLLDDQVGAIPLLWISRPYVYSDAIGRLPVDNLGRVVWESVRLG